MNKQLQKLSIIVPALNEETSLRDTLLPLQSLRNTGHEVILADGGSRDNTRKVAQDLTDKIVSVSKGRAIQMNGGAQHATGEILLFLHADTTLPDNAAQLVLNGLKNTKKVWGRFDVRLSGKHLLLRLVESTMNLRSRITGIATGDQGIFIRRETFEAIGGFPAIPLMEDIAISKKLKRISPPLCLHQKITTSSRRWEQNGIIKTILLMWRLRLAYFFGADPGKLAQGYQSPSLMIYPDARIIIFAKAPVPGQVKTRLSNTLGDEGAAQLHERMTRRTIEMATQAALCPVELWCSPSTDHVFFQQCAQDFAITLKTQQGHDLGTRMSHAFEETLKQHSSAIIIGTDCPTLETDDLELTLRALQQGCDAVLGPAHDGGYVLIALNRPAPEIFTDIAWGSHMVLQSTRDKLLSLGLKWHELDEQRDVDRPEDIDYLRAISPLILPA